LVGLTPKKPGNAPLTIVPSRCGTRIFIEQPIMAVAEKGRRSGWERQANGLVTSHASLATSAKAAVDRGGALLNRGKALRLAPEAGPDPISLSIQTGLARELDQACADIARQKRQSPARAAAPAPRRPASSPVNVAKPAATASAELPIEVGGKALQERADRLAAENGLLAQRLAERNSALVDARARINALEEKLSAAGESASKLTESQQNELRVARDRLQKKLDSAIGETARLSRTATESNQALADARTRVEYLQAALAAAEAECGRQTGEAAKAREKHQAEAARAATAEKLLAEARERLLARIIEIDAVRQRVAEANAVTNAAYDRQRQLEDALCLQQSQFEELERSQSKLAEATKVLMQRFRDRERALAVAKEKIKALAERNAWLEAARDRASGPQQRGRETPHSRLEEAADAALADWAELVRLLGDFVERKTAITPAAPRPRSAA
jgi:predicted nuclease with TOPRIM domain